MRKSDKKKNFLKVNLLAEQRYMKSKWLLKEDFSGPQKTDSDIDDLAREILKMANGDVEEENKLIVSTAKGNEDTQRRLTSRLAKIKLDEI
jgi:hypothetical protein